MKKMIGMIIVACVSLFPALSMATDVGGIIDTDTVWDLAGSPYTIITTVQVAEGVTLTIDPSVTVEEKDSNRIEVWGNLHAIGNEINKLYFENVKIASKNSGFADIRFAEFNSGNPSDWESGGRLVLTDSICRHSSGLISVVDPSGDCYIERNIFENITIWLPNYYSPQGKVHVRNNVFFGQPPNNYDANIAVFSNSNYIIEYNSFLSNEYIAIFGCQGQHQAINNYWNTTDTDVIDSMIYDRNDDLSCSAYIEYMPFLTEPHPDTPTLDLNKPPSANAGPDQIVFDEITLDGSHSLDSDGEIISYQWQLVHRENSGYNKTSEGITPTVSELKKGFYDVILTVEDNEGLMDTDEMFFSATGLKGDFDFDGDVDGSDLAKFASNFGRTDYQ